MLNDIFFNKQTKYDPDIVVFLEIKVKTILDPSKVPLTTHEVIYTVIIHFPI